MTHKIYIKDIYSTSGANRNRLSNECFSQFVFFIAKAESSPMLYLSDLVRIWIHNLRQSVRKAARTHLVMTSGNIQVQGFVRTFSIIDLLPAIKCFLALVKEFATTPAGEIRLHGSMESLVLSQSLRMIGTTMNDLNSQTHHPDRQAGIPTVEIISPGRPIIHQDSPGQAIRAKGPRQMSLNGLFPFISAGRDTEGKSGMIIQDGQGIAASIPGLKIPLIVHLPQIIGSVSTKSLIRFSFPGLFVRYLAIPFQNSRDGRGRGKRPVSRFFQSPFQFTTPPSSAAVFEAQESLLPSFYPYVSDWFSVVGNDHLSLWRLLV